jgi:hypothetical protein
MTVYLTPEEVSARYRGEVTVGTLRNWRAMRIGPTFVKIGKAVLYSRDELDMWDKAHTVKCQAPRSNDNNHGHAGEPRTGVGEKERDPAG